MKPIGNLLILLSIVLALSPATGAAQQVERYEDLRRELIKKQQNTRSEINAINEQIDKYEERLVLAEEKYDRLYNQYEDLKRVIALHDQKISKLETELSHIREEIALTEQEIGDNRQYLERLVENYKKTLTYVYKYGRTSQLALILSASSLNQMLVRAFYLNKFEAHRRQQALDIRETTADLERSKEQLETARDKNANVLSEIRSEKQELAEKIERQEKNVALLRRDREQIETRLREVRRQKNRLNNTLTALINEAERARRLAMNSGEPVEESEYISDNELSSIEQTFAAQKGNLQWPVESSTITEHFGRRRHPVYGTVTENLGVEIVTKPKDTVRVVHDGYVVDVRPIPSYGDVVIVKHGKFYTAYGNLSQVMVRKNLVLKAGDVIGLSGDQNSAKGESVFFMLREGSNNLNPEAWLANK